MYAIQSDAYSHLIVLYRRQCTYIRLPGMTDETVKKVRHDSPGVHVVPPPKFRAVTKALIGGGGYSYILVLPDEFFFKSVVIKVDFKRNSSGRTRIYEYAPPPINVLVTALPKFDTV